MRKMLVGLDNEMGIKTVGFRKITAVAYFVAIALLTLCISSGLASPVHAADTASKYGPFTTGKSSQKSVLPDSSITPSDSLPQKKHEHVKGRVMIKLAPVAVIAATKTSAKIAATDEDVLAEVRLTRGYKGMKRHFKEAKALTKEGEMITTRDGKSVKKPDLTRWHRIDIDESEDIDAKIEELKKIPGIEVAEPDYLRKPAVVDLPHSGSSADPLYGQQWHLGAVKAPEAWAYLQAQGLPPGGTRDVVVAVIDTGIDMTHPDLAANLWTNSLNGTHGRDVVTNTDIPTDDHGHGTHVAGIIAAQANNAAGGVGIAYNVQIMAIKAAQYSGVLAVSDIAEGIYYAVSKGADVINMSFGGYGKSTIEEDALAVAFGQAVLVAAAGNDGLANDIACDKKAKVMYPAGYNWVLGVMASNENPDSSGGYLASFSNYDCLPGDSNEYEIMAPGAGIMSTLPNNQYAAWSGTSMATPVVAGIAALVRTKFPDKNAYPSRFIMGQLATTGSLQQAYTPPKSDPVFYRRPDALAALTSTPKPKLSYLDHWLFDTTTQSATNNNNGRVDAGETIALAVTVRNQWGKADNVSVELEAIAGVVDPDQYVTMLTYKVDYGAIGSFSSDDNGLTRDTAGAITGVTTPFKFSLSPATPNGHIIPFTVTMTARNGFDAADNTVYTTVSHFSLTVTNGTELPSVISQNMTLTKDTLWVVPDATLIEAGVTVTVTEGAKIQFYSSEAKKPYALDPLASITVKGALNIAGTVDAPVEMTLASLYRGRVISIQNQGTGVVNMAYVRMENPSLTVNNIEHSEFNGTGSSNLGETVNGGTVFFGNMHHIIAEKIKTSLFKSLGTMFGNSSLNNVNYSFKFTNWAGVDTSTVNASIEESLFNNDIITAKWLGSSPYFKNNAVLNNARHNSANTWFQSYFSFENYGTCAQQTAQFSNNAILERYTNPDPNTWASFRYQNYGSTPKTDFCLPNNYWGTTSTAIIDALIWDYNNDFSLGKIIYQPILATAPETAYPFVFNVALSKSDGLPTTTVGAGLTTFTVTFNRDMDPTIQPQVSFGPAEPYTDFTVRGDWKDARTWVGTFNISPISGDGYQIIRVAGGRAASDHWLVAGDDSGRFRFEIVTSGTESMNLQATGGEGYVDLSWTQNDFELLAGYHVYRATTASGAFTRINSTIIPPQTKTYHDINVTPGQAYFYKFKVVLTDTSESTFSNVATGTPLDTLAPVITHTPLTSATTGLPLSITTKVTDNVAVKSVTLYFRTIGAASYTSQAMVYTPVVASSYSYTIAGSLVVSPGIEYYLTATDGVSTVTVGRAELPYQIIAADNPVITTITPSKGPSNGGTAVTISGGNFKAGATVTFAGAVPDSVVIVSSNQITCVTQVHFPTAVDVVVTNPGGKTGTSLRGFTFESDTASVSVPALSALKNAIIQMPVNASGINGLAAADITVTFDNTVLTPRPVTTGTLTSGWTIAANSATANQIKISMASPGGTATGTGTLANIEFEVIGAAGGSSAVALSSVKLNSGAIPVTTANGSVTVQQVYSIAGTATLWKGAVIIPAVQMQLSGDRLYAASSAANGTYSVTGVPPGAYTLRPSKTGDTLGITAFDASLVLQHAAGLSTLAGYPAIAADVDKSGTIDSMDVFHILQKAVDLEVLPFQGAGVEWEFTPASIVYGNLNANLTAVNVTGVLLGDVSGNWSATAPTIEGGAPVLLDVSETAPAQDRTLTATISVDPQTQEIYSFDMILSYDHTKGLPVDVKLDAAVSGWMLGYNLAKQGEIRIALAGATPITTAKNLVAIKFNVNDGTQKVMVRVTNSSANEDATINAYRYMLALKFSGTGEGTVSGGISCGTSQSCNPVPILQGTEITLVAVPGSNSTFSGWSGDCTTVNATNCTVTMNNANNVTAQFVKNGNGTCGTSNGLYFTTVPTANLCSSGTIGATSGTGPWSWTCSGTNGGSDAACSANLQQACSARHWTALPGGTSPPLMHLAGNLTIKGRAANSCDEIAAYDSTGNAVGYFYILKNGQYGDMELYGNSAGGNKLTMHVWDGTAQVEYNAASVLQMTSRQSQGGYVDYQGPLTFVENSMILMDVAVETGIPMVLKSGWNMLGWTAKHGYYEGVTAPLASDLISSGTMTSVGTKMISDVFGTMGFGASDSFVAVGPGGVVYTPGSPFNSLKKLLPGKGYWLYVPGDKTLTVPGASLAVTDELPLSQGWSQIGYWGADAADPAAGFGCVNGLYDVIVDEAGKVFVAGSPFNTLKSLQKNKGYFIHTTAPATLRYQCP